jgi:hypothetical protein
VKGIEARTKEDRNGFRRLLSFGLAVLLCITISGPACAQQTQPSIIAVQADGETDDAGETMPIRRKHSRVSRPAEFQGPGILQLEFGYDGNFRSSDLRADQSGSLALSFPVTEWLLLEFSLDTILAQTDHSGLSAKGVGDTRVGFQTTVLEDGKHHPSIALVYMTKLPSASKSLGLGTGRTDHQIMGLASKKIGELAIDLNVGLLINGREMQSGYAKGGQFALGLSRDIRRGIGVQGEISGQTLDADQPRGAFALAALTYQSDRRVIFDIGTRFGLNSTAPRFGFFAGVTVGLVHMYK